MGQGWERVCAVQRMGKEGRQLVGSFDQGGGHKVAGIKTVGQDAGIMSSSRMFICFGSESGVGSIMWLGDSRWGRNGGVRRLWWREMAVAVRHGRGA